jgi:hypothetical protein
MAFRGAAVASATNADRHEMRACTETVRAAAVWADTTRQHPMGQEGVQAVVDFSFRLAHQPELLHSWTQARFSILMSQANSLFYESHGRQSPNSGFKEFFE